ncbi:hypothetical protein P280DRAFT_395742 [Massarina eburnea CBS 473.64]|uniref:N-acetyltransferase domain-containing protein n=1 Tax=Massarina eburnea CBS 473.64 TaxID=1395130 RepID=A0A6A6S5I3_9PLEO|nr:hypothetical protein P280DRAFT_395742 [Massarina eburnea CBS 473.64]
MDQVIFTPRLKLTLVEKAEQGSEEFEWLHEIRCNKEATWWSIWGPSKTVEDTEKQIQKLLPTPPSSSKPRTYRINYAVHSLLSPTSGPPTTPSAIPTKFIGLVSLRSLDPGHLVLPTPLVHPPSDSSTLTVEIAYMYLPAAWGNGYATESINAMFAACERAKDFWTPYGKVYVRSIVNDRNEKSVRVMEKCGMERKGLFVWEAEDESKAVLIAGKMVTTDRLVIWGRELDFDRTT